MALHFLHSPALYLVTALSWKYQSTEVLGGGYRFQWWGILCPPSRARFSDKCGYASLPTISSLLPTCLLTLTWNFCFILAIILLIIIEDSFYLPHSIFFFFPAVWEQCIITKMILVSPGIISLEKEFGMGIQGKIA